MKAPARPFTVREEAVFALLDDAIRATYGALDDVKAIQKHYRAKLRNVLRPARRKGKH